MTTVDSIMKEVDYEYEILKKTDKVASTEIRIPTHLINKVFPLLRDRFDDFQLNVHLTFAIIKIWN
jgi:hypothetical protein